MCNYAYAGDADEIGKEGVEFKKESNVVPSMLLTPATMHFPAKCPHNDCVYYVLRQTTSADLQEAGEVLDPILVEVVYLAKLGSPREPDLSVRVKVVCDPEVTRQGRQPKLIVQGVEPTSCLWIAYQRCAQAKPSGPAMVVEGVPQAWQRQLQPVLLRD